MSLVAAVVVPGAALLVPELAGGSVQQDAGLREQVLGAVRALLAEPRGRLLVVGVAAVTGERTGTWDWSSLGVRARGAGGGPALPLALAIGAWLLDVCGAGPDRTYLGVSPDSTPQACGQRGQELAAAGDLRMLVVGDGSACRSEKAPGHLDARAEPFDAAVQRALAVGDGTALLALDPGLARELQAAGRAPWQVLAGAAAGAGLAAELTVAVVPYGVCYLVARWWRPDMPTRRTEPP